MSLTRGGEEYFYISDGHGDVRIITDEDGHVKTKYRYSGYGELIETSGDIENSRMYAGECYDEESGLYYLRARYMNPSTGTFTGMDSYAGNISDPDTLHKYLYANGNPVKYVDPSGNEAQLSTQVVVGAIMNVLDNGQTICIGAIMNSIIFAGATAFCDGSDNDIYNAFVAGFCIGLGLGAVAYFVMAISFVAYLEIFMYISAGAYALSSYDAINYAMNGEYKNAIVSAAFAFWSLDGFASLYKSFADINLMKGINITEKVEKAKAVLESKDKGGSGTGTVNPKDVRYMQSSIKNQTGDYTVLDNAQALKEGTLKPSDLPEIRIWKDNDGNLWTLDHRRLAAFRIAGVDEVPFRWATDEEVASQMWKMTTKTGGASIKLKLGNGKSIIIDD
ncbi:MAG: RHS repeat-associated core domain-containing protein [Lachnospiraceae bacterium]|nr:RHS repeat-associated core domain-containing protein [Lachnospiraceae bacterium]